MKSNLEQLWNRSIWISEPRFWSYRNEDDENIKVWERKNLNEMSEAATCLIITDTNLT